MNFLTKSINKRFESKWSRGVGDLMSDVGAFGNVIPMVRVDASVQESRRRYA